MQVRQLKKLLEAMPDEADVNLAVRKNVTNSDNISSIVYVARCKSLELGNGGLWIEGEYDGELEPDDPLEKEAKQND